MSICALFRRISFAHTIQNNHPKDVLSRATQPHTHTQHTYFFKWSGIISCIYATHERYRHKHHPIVFFLHLLERADYHSSWQNFIFIITIIVCDAVRCHRTNHTHTHIYFCCGGFIAYMYKAEVYKYRIVYHSLYAMLVSVFIIVHYSSSSSSSLHTENISH